MNNEDGQPVDEKSTAQEPGIEPQTKEDLPSPESPVSVSCAPVSAISTFYPCRGHLQLGTKIKDFFD